MSKLEELIKQLCPNGVKYKRLDEVFESFNGMTGVSNKWKENGNCQFIEYMNAYKNLKINIKLLPFATVKNLQQNTLQKGDILLTCASETPDECAVSSVIEDEIKDNVFLDDHLFGIRVKKDMKSEINTTFINYYMHTNNFRKKINKAVRGVTRFYISIDEFMKICIPVPPLEVQCEIVHILDDFTLLSAELSAELKARQKQFSYYRECLVNNGGHKIRLDKIVDIYLGLTHTPKYVTSGIKFISAQNTSKDYLDLTNVKYISREEYESITQNAKPKKGDILFTRVGSNLGHPVIVDTDEELCMFVSLGYLRVKDTSKVSIDYIKHWINTENFWNQVRKNVHGSAKVNLNTGWLSKFEISIPNFDEQKKIVNILNVLEKLCNDISEGLPAEIEARQRQYEYYRDKLLTFKELKVNE